MPISDAAEESPRDAADGTRSFWGELDTWEPAIAASSAVVDNADDLISAATKLWSLAIRDYLTLSAEFLRKMGDASKHDG